MIAAQRRTAQRMLRKPRRAMGERDSAYFLEGLAELDDACAGGSRPGKRGRGAEGRKPVIFAVERRDSGMGFMTAMAAGSMESENVSEFASLKTHIAVSNFKRYITGTFHGVSHRYLQDCIDESVYRFNRRYWKPQLPLRLLQAAVGHAPVRL